MAAKKSMKESRGRKWSEDELKEFASVLADDRTEFALTLETLALKKSANVHIFEAIKKELDAFSVLPITAFLSHAFLGDGEK